MKTSKEREALFREDLAGLLEMHGAELTVTGIQSGVCKITMQSLWDKDNNQIADYAEFDIDVPNDVIKWPRNEMQDYP